MPFSFERPVGAVADAMELEYIAALHQTDDEDDEGWLDASIELPDIKYYLLSRYGIVVSKKEVRELIFKGLAGVDEKGACIDLVELLSILLIPYFTKIVKQNQRKNDDYSSTSIPTNFEETEKETEQMLSDDDFMISDVLKIILTDSIGSPKPPPLTKEVLRTIFARYNELELIAKDDLLDEMIEMASGGRENAVLDEEAFARALTSDIMKYNPDWENRLSTHYEDVFGFENEKSEKDDGDDVGDEGEETKRDVQRIFNYPQIDILADTFRSKLHFICAVCAYAFTYIAFFNPAASNYYNICQSRTLKCQIGQSIVTWLAIMTNVMISGLFVLLVLSLGNNPYYESVPRALSEIFAGVAGTIFVLFVMSYVKVDWGFINTEQLIELEFDSILIITRIILNGIGIILILLQVFHLMSILFDKEFLKSIEWLNILSSSAAREEANIKKAAAFKIHRMVKNAHNLHRIVERSQTTSEDQSVALLNYTKEGEKREKTGNYFWCWKQFLTGELRYKEGVWIHTRMIAVNIAQLLVTIGVVLLTCLYTEEVVKAVHPRTDDTTNTVNKTSCTSSFDPSLCTFAKVENFSAGFATCLVSYSNECEFLRVPDEVRDLYCSYFGQAQQNSIYDFSSLVSCPELIYPSTLTFADVTVGSKMIDCRAAFTGCVETPIAKNLGHCIVGINTYSNPLFDSFFDFSGPDCDENEAIRELIIHGEQVNTGQEDIWIPNKWAIRLSGTIGTTGAFLVGMYNALASIPSIIVTTLKFRSGVLPSLRDFKFKKYRFNMLQTTSLIGASIWGTFIMSILVYILFFIPVFLFTYEPTIPFMLSFLSFLIGIVITQVIKIVATIIFAKTNYKAFYRKRPVLCNIVSVAFECWHLALTASFILFRTFKLILITFAFLGRFDTPLLQDGIGYIGPVNLDNYPFIFRKDILATDAHRHPYLERLGHMYMMKLRYGDGFAKRSGSIWRLLFIFALMPWLQKYRIHHNSLESRDEDTFEKYARKSYSKVIEENNQLRQEIQTLRQRLALKHTLRTSTETEESL